MSTSQQFLISPFTQDVSKLSEDSHANVLVSCQLQLSENCIGTKEMTYRDTLATMKKNNGKYYCFFCSKKEKNISDEEIDHDFFEAIDTLKKSYLLGWIASIGIISSDDITIEHENLNFLIQLKNIISEVIPIKTKANSNLLYFKIDSKKCSQDISKWLFVFNQEEKKLQFPVLSSDELKWVFLRGYFEGVGHLSNPEKNMENPYLYIPSYSSLFLNGIQEFSKIPSTIANNRISYHSLNALDFLGKIYLYPGTLFYERKYDLYCNWIKTKSSISQCLIKKQCVEAVIPTRGRPTDAGYDLTIIKEVKKISDKITLYDTGLTIKPALNMYAEISPEVRLVKQDICLQTMLELSIKVIVVIY